MAVIRHGAALQSLRTLFEAGSIGGLSDRELLERFLDRRDEHAFAALVHRHGPMVLELCRQALGDLHDAEDAFQATFLVLASRAGAIRRRDSLASWLFGVARRVAARAKVEAARRRAHERRAARMEAIGGSTGGDHLDDRALYEEIARLPEKYREPVVLCDLEGLTQAAAAERLRCPVGTVGVRLMRARERLRSGLARRGVVAPAGLAVAVRSPRVSETAVPSVLVEATVRAALDITAGMATGAVPASVARLVNGSLRGMLMSRITIAAAGTLLALGATGGGTALFAHAGMVTMAAGPPDEAITREKSVQVKPGDESLLTDGGAEQGEDGTPEAWSKGAAIPGVEYVWDRATAHGGEASLCLKKTAQRFFPIAQWSQEIDRKGDTPRLRVVALVKAERAAKAILDVQFIDGDGMRTHAWAAYIGAKEEGDPPSTHDWKRYGGVVAIPPGTERIIVAPQIYGPGTVWFDDLRAEYTEDPETDPIGS